MFRLVRVILNCITNVIKCLINVYVMYQTLPIICPMCCIHKHSLTFMISFCIFISSGFCWKKLFLTPYTLLLTGLVCKRMQFAAYRFRYQYLSFFFYA